MRTHPRPRRRLEELLAELKRRLRWKDPDPEAPYALVGAPKKPRTPLRSASAAVQPER